jgi:hypothetical protein
MLPTFFLKLIQNYGTPPHERRTQQNLAQVASLQDLILPRMCAFRSVDQTQMSISLGLRAPKSKCPRSLQLEQNTMGLLAGYSIVGFFFWYFRILPLVSTSHLIRPRLAYGIRVVAFNCFLPKSRSQRHGVMETEEG